MLSRFIVHFRAFCPLVGMVWLGTRDDRTDRVTNHLLYCSLSATLSHSQPFLFILSYSISWKNVQLLRIYFVIISKSLMFIVIINLLNV